MFFFLHCFFFTFFQTICEHGTRLAALAIDSDQLSFQIFELVLKIRHQYQGNSDLNKLRKVFLSQFGTGVLAHRRACEYWRSIKFAILNDVPRKHFLITNWRRMQEKMATNWDSDSDDTDSSTYRDVLRSPLIEGLNSRVLFPLDSTLSCAIPPFQPPSPSHATQSSEITKESSKTKPGGKSGRKKNKRKHKNKKVSSSSPCPSKLYNCDFFAEKT
jgi:hypothetical protein